MLLLLFLRCACSDSTAPAQYEVKVERTDSGMQTLPCTKNQNYHSNNFSISDQDFSRPMPQYTSPSDTMVYVLCSVFCNISDGSHHPA